MSKLIELLTAGDLCSPLCFVLVFLLGYLVYVLLKQGEGNGGSSSKDGNSFLPLPGPWGVPVLGNLLQLTKKPHRKLTEYRKKYGDVYQITMGSRPAVILNGYDMVWRACVKQADDFAGRPDFYTFQIIGNGKSMGFGDYGRRWKTHRKIAQNALSTFANNRVNPIEDIIANEASVLVTHLLKEGKKPFNPHNEIYLSVGNIICAICFGKRYQRDDPDFLRLVELNDQFMAYAAAGNPVDIMPWTRHLLTKSLNSFVDILNIMNKFCEKKQQEHLDTYSPDVMRDITDILIRTVKEMPEEEKDEVGLTDEHILTTVQELIGAGFDTISTTLQWALLFLMTHKHVQERAHEEIRREVGLERAIRMDDLARLPFMEAVMLEVMRHSSLFPLALPHSTTKDTVLHGFLIPKDTLVLVNLWSLVRDRDVFEDPERFYPDRFILDQHQHDDNNGEHSDCGGKNDGAAGVGRSRPAVNRELADKFLPYGAGRRRCPGEQLAKMELFLFMGTIIQKCRFDVPAEGPQPVVDSNYGLTLKPQDFQTVITARV